jgi:ribosome-associated protein
MLSDELLELARLALEDLKARDIRVLDVRDLTTVADYLIVASGTSKRHVQSISDRLIEAARHEGQRPIGVEGRESGEWILIDLADVIVHVMQPATREFYKLEDLWSVGSGPAAGSAQGRNA